MSLIELPNTELPPAQKIALQLLTDLNTQLDARVQAHKAMWGTFWDNSAASPEEILAQLGTGAHLLVKSQTESARHIGEVASWVGKSASDFLEPEHINGLKPLTVHPDGTVTIDE